MDPVDSPRGHSLGVPVPDTDVKIVDTEAGSQELQSETDLAGLFVQRQAQDAE